MADTLNSTLTENTSVQAQITTRTQRNGSQDSAVVDLYAKTTGPENTFSNVHGIQIGKIAEGNSTRGYISAVTHATRGTPFIANDPADIVTKSHLDTTVDAAVDQLTDTITLLRRDLTAAQALITELQGALRALPQQTTTADSISSHTVDILGDNPTAIVNVTTDNPHIRINNDTVSDINFIMVRDGEDLEGLINAHETIVINPGVTGNVVIHMLPYNDSTLFENSLVQVEAI